MKPLESPFLFDCEGSLQIGIFHQPIQAEKTGIVMVVAGGPQYRVGRARQLVMWARQLAEAGYPVLRFDYRGLGDSAGTFQGFEHIDKDIQSAIDQLESLQAGVESIVLWGECNSTSAIMMYAWQDPRVKGMIIRDPWVREESTQAKTYIKYYYLQRLREKAFWLKVFKGQFNITKSLSSMRQLLHLSKPNKTEQNQMISSYEALSTYQEKMFEGFSRFTGKTLLLINGSSLTGREFEVLVDTSANWKRVMAKNAIDRIDDHIRASDDYSLLGYGQRICQDAIQWLKQTSF